MIKVQNLSYEYPGKRALDNVSFTIKKGSITALVGPNGAGKTTLMRCLAALDEPFSGSIKVDNIDTKEHPREIHKKIGYLSDFFGTYSELTVAQALEYIAGIRGIPEQNIKKRIDTIAAELNLTKHLNNNSKTLSRGLTQRLGIAMAMIHEPEILILDEPASGLDPEARISLSHLLVALQKKGVTLMVSSHILAELEDYCTEMLLIRNGKLVSHSEAKESRSNTIQLVLYEKANDYIVKLEKLKLPDIKQIDDYTLTFTFDGDAKEVGELMQKLVKKKIPVSNLHSKNKKLQDIYMDHAEKLGDK